MNCRSCGESLMKVLHLGVQPPSNALLKSVTQASPAYSLALAVCENCRLLQTTYEMAPEDLFGDDYPFYSGQSKEWIEHCRTYAAEATRRFDLGPRSLVVEIGGNDGTLLKNFECQKLNVEPSGVAAASMSASIPTMRARWEGVLLGTQADLIIGNNVLGHTPQLNEFVASVKRNLKGIATFEFPWAVKLLSECQFDTIYHEHYSYLSLTAVIPLFKRHGLKVIDVEQITTHGGSLRVYVAHTGEVAASRMAEVITLEAPLGKRSTYEKFARNAERSRKDFTDYVRLHDGMYAYGAAAKGNTLLNWCGLTSQDITAVGDTTPAKQGKFMPGSRIPIVSEAEIIAAQPKKLAILPWNWKTEIIAKLRPLLPRTQFVTAIPSLEVQ